MFFLCKIAPLWICRKLRLFIISLPLPPLKIKKVLKEGTIVAGTEFGTVVQSDEYDNCFFRIEVEVVKNFPPEIRALYELITKYNFSHQIDYIYIKKLLDAPTVHKKLVNFKTMIKKKITADDLDPEIKLCLIKDDSFSHVIFHSYDTGLFFRDKGNLAPLGSMNKDLKIFFREDHEAKAVLENLIKIHKEIYKKLKNIEPLFISEEDPSILWEQISNHEDVPAIWSKQLAYLIKIKGKEKDKNAYMRNARVAHRSALNLLDERLTSLEKVLYAAPIDMFLLYVFYLFEESRKNHERHDVIPDLLDSYGDFEELSVVGHLGEYAHQVMEKLGINLNEMPAMKKQVRRTLSKPARSKPQTKAKKKRAKASPKIVNIETVKAEKYPPHPTKWLHSLSDSTASNNIQLELSKEHRLLDTIARLLSQELYSGSTSVLVVCEDGIDKLLITTKHNRNQELVFTALQNMLVTSNKIGKKIDDDFFRKHREDIINISTAREQCSDKEHRFLFGKQKKSRKKIDHAKLFIAMNNPKSSSAIYNSIINILNNVTEKNILVVDNPFKLHSELKAIEYVLHNGLFLDYVTRDGKQIPYQYIGGSLLTCGKCKALISGNDSIHGINSLSDTNNIAFFTRGSYSAGYPGYIIPWWAVNVNHNSSRNIRTLLNACPPTQSYSLLEYFNSKEAEMSESES
jgi:hypothetical protein